MYASIGMEGSTFTGKDYSNFMSICSIYYANDDYDRLIIMHVCEHLEGKHIEREKATLAKQRKK